MTWNEERFAPSCNRNNWDQKKAGRPLASRLKPTGRARWAGSGPLFRLTAHCLYEEASPPWDLCAFADFLSRETALSFFLYGFVAVDVKEKFRDQTSREPHEIVAVAGK